MKNLSHFFYFVVWFLYIKAMEKHSVGTQIFNPLGRHSQWFWMNINRKMKSWTDPTNFLKPSCQNVSGWCLASMSCNIWACFWWNDGWALGGSLPRPGLRHQSAPGQSVLLRGGSGHNNDVPMVLDWILIWGTGNSQRHWCLHQCSIIKQQKKSTPHWSDIWM